MGDEILIVNIAVIQGGLLQIDFENVTQNKTDRCFAQPGDFFKMIGDAMQKNHVKDVEAWQRSIEVGSGK